MPDPFHAKMSHPNLVIRPARPEDTSLILELIRALGAYERLSHEVVATELQLQAALFGERPAAECLLAEVDEVTAGFAVYYPTFSTFLAKAGLHLEDLFVKPAFRGQGIGKALLLRVAHIANQRGCGRMEWTVLDWNQPAIEFYDSLGAQRLPDWKICRLAGADLQRYA
ncbi:MAG: GNAT family N-acetyltransferase [Cephaloticoccus sp.]